MKYQSLKSHLIAVDIDGTIIDNNLNIDYESIEILKELSKNNIVVLATGRPWRSSKQYYDLLELNSPIINYNGAYVHHPKDKNFKERMVTINKNIFLKLLDDNKDIIINAFCEIRDDLYLLKLDDLVKPFLDLDGANLILGDFNKTLAHNSNGAIIFTKGDKYKVLEEYIKDYSNEILIRPWEFKTTYIVELYNTHISKAKAILEICKYYSIDPNNTIAFGDGINDLDMLSCVKYGVAMEGGNSDILKKAKYTTSSVKEHGLAKFFKNFEF